MVAACRAAELSRIQPAGGDLSKRKPGPIEEDSFKTLAKAIAGAKLTELGIYVAWLVGEEGITADQIVSRAKEKFQDIWPAIRARRQPAKHGHEHG